MDNPQAIHWFLGFFEGEGCFTIRKRQGRGSVNHILLEPKVCLSNTNPKAIEFCENVLRQNSIRFSKSLDSRIGKLPCWSLDISCVQDIKIFCMKFCHLLECDRERCEIFLKFCNSRLSRERYADYNDYEWSLFLQLKQWRASETTRDESFTHSVDWLAGVSEAESSIVLHTVNKQHKYLLCNTNNLIIYKAQQILTKLGCGPHIKLFQGTIRHQPFWHLSIYGTVKVKRFWSIIRDNLQFRRQEWEKIMI